MSIPKQITFIDEDNQVLIDAVKDFCGPVISTLGPGGCTVIITDDNESLPKVTKDGVTVSESIFFRDQRKQAIASLIKEAARKTANAVGDGTTTSVVLAQDMILKGLESLKSVSSKKEFFDGFDLAFEKVVDILSDNTVSITKDSVLLESVVKISANNDDKICKIIMSAVKAAGPDGLVNIELNDELKTIVDVKGGASLESNTIIPNGKRWESDAVDIELVLVSGAIRETHEITTLLGHLNTSKNPAIIIAKEFSDIIINTVMVNNQRKSIDVVLVESEGFARNARMDILEDLSVIFNVPIYSTDGNTPYLLNEYTSNIASEVNRVIVTPNETVIFRAEEELLENARLRYKFLKQEYEDLKLSAEVDQGSLHHLQRRMAKYNVVATIKVGASTKAEAVEIKDRMDDAVSAISAAINGGITQGGGMALVRAGMEVYSAEPEELSKDAKLGYQLLVNSCYAPFKSLAKNSGVAPTEDKFSDELLVEDNVFDFKNCEIVNWLDAGIIDPVLVPISALTNASSVAKTILKSNSIISEWQDIMVG